MRLHLFEFEDLPWFPDAIRVGGTDYLRYFLIATRLYKPVLPLIAETLLQTKDETIVDLCSGGGGYIEQVYEGINDKGSRKIKVLLTDKFPNLESYRLLKEKTNGGIDYFDRPVDAMDVPKEISGFRVMFSAVHHFKPEQVGAVLRNAVEHRAAIGLFDGGDKNILSILGMLLIHPIAFFLFTPFFKPFKLSRLFFTYIIPLIPIYTIWDGCVSVLRFYQPDELLKIAQATEAQNYIWKHGKVKNRFGLQATFLIGRPVQIGDNQ